MARKNKQAIKRHKQNLENRDSNKHVKSTVRSRIKLFLEAVESGKLDVAREAYKTAQAYIDKAATKKVLHHGNAARKVGRLAKKLKALETAPAAK